MVRRVSFVGYGCLVGDHDDGGHCGPGLPAFAAPFRCTVDPAAPPCQPRMRTRLPKILTTRPLPRVTLGLACVRSKATAPSVQRTGSVSDKLDSWPKDTEKLRATPKQHRNGFWYSYGALQRKGAFSLPDEVGARPTLAVSTRA